MHQNTQLSPSPQKFVIFVSKNRAGEGQGPFETFPKINPFWRVGASQRCSVVRSPYLTPSRDRSHPNQSNLTPTSIRRWEDDLKCKDADKKVLTLCLSTTSLVLFIDLAQRRQVKMPVLTTTKHSDIFSQEMTTITMGRRRDDICHKHHKQSLRKIITTRVKLYFVDVF